MADGRHNIMYNSGTYNRQQYNADNSFLNYLRSFSEIQAHSEVFAKIAFKLKSFTDAAHQTEVFHKAASLHKTFADTASKVEKMAKGISKKFHDASTQTDNGVTWYRTVLYSLFGSMYNSGPYNTKEYNGRYAVPSKTTSAYPKTGESIEVQRPEGYVEPQQT